MSYILEALKKAQAERQLGSAPTIHATPSVPAAPAGVAANRKPLLAGLAAGALLASAALVVAWRHQPAQDPVSVAANEPAAPASEGAHIAIVPSTAAGQTPDARAPGSGGAAATPTVPAPRASDRALARAPELAGAAITPASRAADRALAPAAPLAGSAHGANVPQVPASTSPIATVPAPPASGPRVTANVAVSRAAAPSSPARARTGAAARIAQGVAPRPAVAAPAPEPVREAALQARVAALAANVAASAATAPAPGRGAAEDNVPPFSALPEAIQRELPKLSFGGYIYSPNPDDRLVLVDKVLRHEGEEVAPGLVLERLLPKAAVMNYKGYRYRVPY